MKLRHFLLLVAFGIPIFFGNVGTAFAAEHADPAAAGDATGVRRFDVKTDADFSNYRQAVVEYLRSQPSRKDAHICILGERDDSGARSASIWWREGARLIEWEGRAAKLAASISNLDLRRDVVAGEDDLHGSSYLVTRRWVADFKARCVRDGTLFTVRRSELGSAPARH